MSLVESGACGTCGSRLIRYRNRFSGEALCQKCTDKYLPDWYVAKNMQQEQQKEGSRINE